MQKLCTMLVDVIDLFGPVELMALAMFLATVGVWAVTIGALLGHR